MTRIGTVIIGRNEGERLRRCLDSLTGSAGAHVYVDSGSTDGSVALARSKNVHVVELDLSRPFTAARARNEGFDALLHLNPKLTYVQFVDGDCEIIEGWIDRAVEAFEGDGGGRLAVVCGRRRERFPDASVYNLLCDIEWNTPVGPAGACGGDALMRVEAVKQVGGYDPTVIAAEDDDLCVRLRQRGWTVQRIDADMTLHDAAMTRLGQWWKRAVRAGHAFAQVRQKHRGAKVEHFVREARGVWVWGALVPIVTIAAAAVTGGWGLLLAGSYGYLGYRVYRHTRGRGFTRREARLYAVNCTAAKFPQLIGTLQYWKNRLGRRPSTLIEYKHAQA